MRVLLDTNVVTRLAQPAHAHYALAVRAVEALKRRHDEPCLVPQVLYEFWAVITRPTTENGLGFSPAEGRAELEQLKRLFPLLLDERAIYPAWERLVALFEVRGKAAHDARLAAAMERHGLTHIMTFNIDDFARFSHLNVLSPQSVASAGGAG